MVMTAVLELTTPFGTSMSVGIVCSLDEGEAGKIGEIGAEGVGLMRHKRGCEELRESKCRDDGADLVDFDRGVLGVRAVAEAGGEHDVGVVYTGDGLATRAVM